MSTKALRDILNATKDEAVRMGMRYRHEAAARELKAIEQAAVAWRNSDVGELDKESADTIYAIAEEAMARNDP